MYSCGYYRSPYSISHPCKSCISMFRLNRHVPFSALPLKQKVIFRIGRVTWDIALWTFCRQFCSLSQLQCSLSSYLLAIANCKPATPFATNTHACNTMYVYIFVITCVFAFVKSLLYSQLQRFLYFWIIYIYRERD